MMKKTPKFRSKPEEELYNLLNKAKLEPEYECKRFPVTITKKTTYIPDFHVQGVYIECKSPHRYVKESLIKLQAFVEQHPNVTILMVGEDIDKPIPRWKRMTLRKFCDLIDIPIVELKSKDLKKTIKKAQGD